MYELALVQFAASLFSSLQIEITIQDQLPSSTDKDIKVKLIEPDLNKVFLLPCFDWPRSLIYLHPGSECQTAANKQH
jgi:hypothetical protein